MVTYLTSGLPAFAFVALAIVAVGGGLVFYALRIKGDVHAEFSHGKTTLIIDARDRRNTRRSLRGKTSYLPMHSKDVKKGTLEGIKKQLGLK